MCVNKTKEDVIKAIKGSAGIVSHVAESLGISWHTADTLIKRWDMTKRAFEDEKETVLDLAENKVIEAINDKDMQTVRWFLATKGKNRGFTEKLEIDAQGDLNINVKIEGLENG